MSKILLDYVFPISVIVPTPSASTAFLKQACVVAKPKTGQEGNVGNIYECTNMTQVAARTDNTNAQQLFNAGMNKVYILLANNLDLTNYISDGAGGDFYTLLISDDFSDSDISEVIGTPAVAAYLEQEESDELAFTFKAQTPGTGGNSIHVEMIDDASAGDEWAHADLETKVVTIHMEAGTSTAQQIKDAVDDSVSASSLIKIEIAEDQEDTAISALTDTALGNGAAAITSSDIGVQAGNWEGVIGVSSDDTEILSDHAAVENRVAFYGNSTNKAKNMFYAFGKLLSSTNWRNQQYVTMPFSDDIDELGEAESLFDDKVSFVISDSEFGKRLALFAVGGKAIVAPYILKNLRIDLQSRALQWISENQPQYTKKEAALLETRLQEDVINEDYVNRDLIESGKVEISLVNSNFVANGTIIVAEPKGLWRVESEMTQTV